MNTNKPILDACCGGKMFWFNHDNPNVIFVDNRIMDRQVIWKSKDGKEVREFEVKPDVVADFQHLPFDNEQFYHVVFDPPHLTSAGETSWLAKKYGRLTDGWREVLRNGFRECMRVLKPYVLLYLNGTKRILKFPRLSAYASKTLCTGIEVAKEEKLIGLLL